MAAYGIRILEGSLDSIAAYPSVKENLLVDIPSYKGVVYDDSLVKFATRTALLKCHMKAESLEAFWRNRDAFLYDITAPRAYDSSIENDDICSLGKKTLYVTPLGKGVDFFYKDCSVGSFFCDAGAVWFDFTLSLEFFKGVI